MSATYERIEFLVARSWEELAELWPEGRDEPPAEMPAELQKEGYIFLETPYRRDWITLQLRHGLIEARFYAQYLSALPDPDYEEEAQALADSVASLESAYGRVGRKVDFLEQPTGCMWKPWKYLVS